MYFMITGTDKPGMSAMRAALREKHIAYWSSLKDRVKLGGPLLAVAEPDAEPCASVLIVEAESSEEAIHIGNKDPFAMEGVFSQVTVSPMRLTLGQFLKD